jgi:hypothetical protein
VRRTSLDPTLVRAIAQAVERQGGGDVEVAGLVATWERLRQRLATVSTNHEAGNTAQAEADWQQLEREFSKPLDAVVRDHLEREHGELGSAA